MYLSDQPIITVSAGDTLLFYLIYGLCAFVRLLTKGKAIDGKCSKFKSFLLALSFSLYIIPVTDSLHKRQIRFFIPQCNESRDTRQQLLFTPFIHCNIILYAIFVLVTHWYSVKWQYLQLTDSTTWLNVAFCQIAACCYASNTSIWGVEHLWKHELWKSCSPLRVFLQ